MDYYSRIAWVNEYIKDVSPFIRVRREDCLLIKIPNQAYKLNAQAVAVVSDLLEGKSVYSIIDAFADKETVARDLHFFFSDLRAVLKGCYHERQERYAVEKFTFALGFNELPVLSEIAVTYRCNLTCRFCYAACGCKKDNSRKECDLRSMKKILRIIRDEAKVPSVSFTGGEPMLRKDLTQLIAYAKSLSLWTNLITNGTCVTHRAAEELKAAGLDSAQVSIEAGCADLHDSIVQQEGSFDKTCAGVCALRDAGIRVHTNTTISALNKDSLRMILPVVKSLGMDRFSMNMLMPEGSAKMNMSELFVSYSEIGACILDIRQKAAEMGLEFMWYSPTPLCIFNPVVHGLGNKGCAACDGLLSIAPNGDILPCSSFPKPMANIVRSKGKFREIWRSEAFAYFQKKKFAHQRCQACEHLAVCNGACPLYWDAVGFQELHRAHEELPV
ncbi:MAG TPA: radical SAM protein [Candidatus Omnitrophota bacterium]|nr:radical SAM protein [Candidatus Omnitrophota bacterium]HPT06599.1 radical SAM protein [Candidatus Omnitrophota bacterium]